MIVAGLAALAGCRNKKDVEHAKHSVYDTDFAVVYSAALDATRELYPNLDDNPGNGAIKTAWHQVSYANNQDELANQRTLASGQGVGGQNVGGQANAGMPTRLAYKRYFIRFDVTVAGGRPWRVKVIGHASEWEPGNAMPTELRGAAKPPWLDGRTDALTLAIYKRIKSFAVPMKEEVVEAKPEDNLPKTDPKAFGNVPPAAAKRLAELKDAVVLRNYGTLRAQLWDDLEWSLGGDPNADTALAMWQADPESLDAMARLITGGCAGDAKRVTCPPGERQPGKWQLVLELRGDQWKVASFVKGE
ncbi:MAG TPA: hypothetical protein VFQ53_26035 [Kofleriaceae bacterium]|nr:hypothetical protein [Kofleriaceae bacterium]